MEINGWKLYQHQCFSTEYTKLVNKVEKLASINENYIDHPSTKLLKKVTDLITKEIPQNPNSKAYLLGNTLGTTSRHWRRAKFGRYRLFFRYSSKHKMIIYAWLNDDKTFRKVLSKTDPYLIFKKMLKKGEPPNNWENLIKKINNL